MHTCNECQQSLPSVHLRYVDKDGLPIVSPQQWPIYRELLCVTCWGKRVDRQAEQRVTQ